MLLDLPGSALECGQFPAVVCVMPLITSKKCAALNEWVVKVELDSRISEERSVITSTEDWRTEDECHLEVRKRERGKGQESRIR